jgi:DNA-binding beta-propeller fold protein YncE
MNLRRVGALAAGALATVLWMACGDIYRPVVIPTTTTPPSPANFHAVFALTTDASVNLSTGTQYFPGTAFQIDVSGDTSIGQMNAGVNPTHAAILPNNSRVFVANAGSIAIDASTGLPGADTVISFSPAAASTTASGLGNPVVFTLPNMVSSSVCTATSGMCSCPYLPDFITTAQNNAVFVANYGVENSSTCNLSSTDSVVVLNTAQNTISNLAYLPAGSHPVALAHVQSPAGNKLYVANVGTNTVTSFNTVDMSTNAMTGFSGTTPVWIVARTDGQRVYVLTQGDGRLVPIDATTDTVLASQTNLSVGAGANFVLYDPNLNRLYVTNPSNSTTYVFSATGGLDPVTGTPNDTPTLLATISLSTGTNAPCPRGCSPVGLAALPDGSRFYVASYETQTACSDRNVGGGPCVIPRLTVFDALSFAIEPASSSLVSPSLSLLMQPQFAATQYAVPSRTSCVPTPIYTPGSTRFRIFATAAADSSHVYVSMCDAGAIADVFTTTSAISSGSSNAIDMLASDLIAPSGVCTGTAGCSGGQPPPQTPIFLLTGQ